MEWNLNNKFSKKNLFLSLDFEVLINHSMIEIHPFPKKKYFYHLRFMAYLSLSSPIVIEYNTTIG